jgi:hypothetical protein
MDCFASCLALILFVFTFVIWLLGVALFVAGIWMIVEYSDMFTATGDYSLTYVASITLGLAVFLMLIGFLGCCGTCKKSKCMLYLFSVILFVLVLAEVGLGIAAFVLNANIQGTITNGLNSTMPSYFTDKAQMDSWDFVQEQFDCCGTYGAADWNMFLPAIQYPQSCCNGTSAQCTMDFSCQPLYSGGNPNGAMCVNTTSTSIFTEGCGSKISNIMDEDFIIIGAMLLVFGCAQLLGVCVACVVAKGFAKTEYA